MRIFLVIIILLIVSGCTGLPEGVTPVGGFDVNKYMGKCMRLHGLIIPLNAAWIK